MAVLQTTNIISAKPPVNNQTTGPSRRASASPTGSSTREIIQNPGDERIFVPDARKMPYLGLCLLKSFSYNLDGTLRAEIFGTGWFSTPNTVVTAGHNLFNPMVFGTARNGWANTVHVYPAYNGENSPPYGGFEQSEQLYVPIPYQQTLDINYDIGILRFEQSISAEKSFLYHAVLGDEQLVPSQLLIAGYPLDLGSGLLMYEGNDWLKAYDSNRLYYEVDTGKGQSGAPVFLVQADQSVIVVGIHAHNSSQTPVDYYPANSATRITPSISAWIQQYN